MQNKFSFAILSAIVVLSVFLTCTIFTTNKLQNELYVLRAQSQSRAEIILVEKDVAQLNSRVLGQEFQFTIFKMKLGLLENKKPEVSLQDMQSFAATLEESLKTINGRLDHLDEDYFERHKKF